MGKRPPTHRPQRPNTAVHNDRAAQARKLRSSWRWRRFRLMQIRKYPLCQADGCDGPKAGVEVHHITKIVDNPSLAFSPRNCPPVCEECHDRISTLERAGKGAEAQSLFATWRQKWEE